LRAEEKAREKQAASLFLGLPFNLEDGGNIFLGSCG
jgi:hypothetical protein